MYDEDSVGSDFLGEYRLKLSTVRADVKEAYSIYLQNKTEVNKIKKDNQYFSTNILNFRMFLGSRGKLKFAFVTLLL